MTQPKFTPAPWEVKSGKDYKDNYTVYTSNNNYHIAYITTDGDNDYYIHDDIQKANANLIATAPEMYEMLYYIHKVLVPNAVEKGICTEEIFENQGKISNLLKKARGEEMKYKKDFGFLNFFDLIAIVIICITVIHFL